MAAKGGEPPEVIGRVLGGDTDHRQVEMPADHLGDPAERNAFVVHGMQPSAGRVLLQRQAVEPSDVQRVAGGPSVGAVAHVGRHTLGPVPSQEGNCRVSGTPTLTVPEPGYRLP